MDRGAGDFLIRGLTSIDEATGSLTVTDRLAVGTTIQFQVRDAAAADEELRRLTQRIEDPGGILLFSCNARGERFFGSAHHDAAAISDLIAPPALAGFFAAGELGPVGRSNHVHTFTASMVELSTGADRPALE
jgi:small ligand-binding sensory domain FIST